eukprot:gi/632975980/ref/XP_007904535.1/ PREDICTED: peptide chain release factor 1-like, mitochondrial [Callorhinchus milii]
MRGNRRNEAGVTQARYQANWRLNLVHGYLNLGILVSRKRLCVEEKMLFLRQTIPAVMRVTSSHFCQWEGVARPPLEHVRRTFCQRARRGPCLLVCSKRAAMGWNCSLRAFSTDPHAVEELFARGSLQQYLERLESEYMASQQRLQSAQASEEEVKGAGKRARELAPLVTELHGLRVKVQELEDIETLMKDEDADLRKLAESDWNSCQEDIRALKHKIISLVTPSEETDESDLILEVLAGVGGQEAMLFTADVFNMYRSYATYKSWHFETLEYFPSELGGLRHATASISGREVYRHLKYEGGVHRVQRVPKTERQGRLHTSTMTVALLPQPSEIHLTINPKDLRIETKRASGAGGQHVNTTDSAVRILHIPTGFVAECQQERSQLKNKSKAMQLLRAKLYSARLEEETTKRSYARKIQIGTKGRAEKIRTYNFPQDRITDHRIGKSLHDMRSFLLGEGSLDEMIQDLMEFADTESLLELLDNDTDSKQEALRDPRRR